MSSPKPIPEIVYKYRSWQNELHKSCLIENDLYFPSPKEINDPFDFRIFMNLGLLDTDEKIQEYLKKAFSKKDNEQSIEELGGYEEAMRKNFSWIKQFPEEVQEYLNNKEEEKLIRFRILCLSEIWDSILMWSHYGDQHRGYCLGFETQSFNRFGLYGPVHYQEEYPIINPLELETFQSMFLHTLCKSKEWHYEREFRIVEILSKSERLSGKPFIFKNAVLKEVILGLNIAYDDALSIGAICKKRGVRLYKVEKIPNKFEITRVEIPLTL